MPKIALPIHTFQYPTGAPVANGFIVISLSQAGSVNDTQLQSNSTRIPLDSSGVIAGSPTFWPNADISPAGTCYIVSVYSAQGQLVAGPNKITV
jgi:hypothetical protein